MELLFQRIVVKVNHDSIEEFHVPYVFEEILSHSFRTNKDVRFRAAKFVQSHEQLPSTQAALHVKDDRIAVIAHQIANAFTTADDNDGRVALAERTIEILFANPIRMPTVCIKVLTREYLLFGAARQQVNGRMLTLLRTSRPRRELLHRDEALIDTPQGIQNETLTRSRGSRNDYQAVHAKKD